MMLLCVYKAIYHEGLMTASTEIKNAEVQQFLSSCITAQQISHSRLTSDERLFRVHKIDGGCSLYKLSYNEAGKPINGEWFQQVPHRKYTDNSRCTESPDKSAQAFGEVLASSDHKPFSVFDCTQPSKLNIKTVDDWSKAMMEKVINNEGHSVTLLIDIDTLFCFDEKEGRINIPVSHKGRLYFFDTDILNQLMILRENGHNFILLNSENTSFSKMKTLLNLLEFEIKPCSYLNRLGGKEVLPAKDISGQIRVRQWGLTIDRFVSQFALDSSYRYIGYESGVADPENVLTRRVSGLTSCVL